MRLSHPFFPITEAIREMIALEFDMWTRRLLICLILALTTLLAVAMPRNFPANAMRGTMSAGMYPQITIDGQTQTLAPGAKIMSRQNTIMMPSTLMNNVYIVNYTFDNQGFVNMIWVLTKEELAQSQ
ncbi:MAG TPA: hypothetical protein VK832_11010 [Burkholderiaceae bacterium]|jgi:hypothetical protein|nr:hypothetical protein [Burkholderiaceae bacterium]